jgi:hypothetical protein
MDHADVLDRLATAFSGPGKLASVDADDSIEGEELRLHLESCKLCRTELEAWRLTSLALAAVTPDSLRAPVEARGRVLAAVAATGVARGGPDHEDQADLPDQARADQARPRRLASIGGGADGLRFRWLAVAAAVAVLLFVAGALLGPSVGFTPESQEHERQLAQVITGIDRILEQPGHLAAALLTADGRPGGAVVLDPAGGTLAVLSTELAPASSQTYDCFLIRGAARTRIGRMFFSDQTSYWVGSVGAFSNPGQPGDVFEVRLGGTAGPLSLSGSF